MIQKAILQIDCSKGVKKGGLPGSRFRAEDSVTAQAADKLRKGAARTVKKVPEEDMADGLITVQYNPASIRYHASTSMHKTVEPDVGDNTEMVTTITGKSTVDMSFQLVFHSTGDKDESVREQMELVMNMIYDSPTRKVKFAWREIEMEGKLVSFSGEYDMFDAMGRPTSGNMQLTIRTEMTVKQVEGTLDKLDEKRKNKPAVQDKEE